MKSIQNFVGGEGTFVVQEFEIFKQRNTIVAIVKCPIAIETRSAAKLQSRQNYNQEMTVGIFKNLDLPRDVKKCSLVTRKY